ncbi:MAG: AAA family ATPase [Phycisphaerae bacterium]|nr:AAA family ATPase [Phycisphaerae bacterium]
MVTQTGDQLATELQHEQSYLSCLMQDARLAAVGVGKRVPPEAFHRPEHRLLYEAIVDVASDNLIYPNGLVDLTVVADRLRDKGNLSGIGVRYMVDLADQQGLAANHDYYAERVREHWALRRAMAAQAAIAAALTGVGPIPERLAEAREHAARFAAASDDIAPAAATFGDFEPRTISWLWPEVLPAGMFVTMVSEEGVGKSTLAGWIAATITKGGQWPNAGSVEAGQVIWFSAEESAEYVLLPRFIANGGVPGSILQGPRPFDAVDDIRTLDAMCAAYPDVRLIVFDPITSYIGGNENSNVDVRRALEPLVRLAERRSICVLGLSHLNKKVDLRMINRTLGSRAWSAVPRMVWTVTASEEAADPGERLLLNIKSNIGPKPEGLKFAITAARDFPSVGAVNFSGERTRQSVDPEETNSARLIDECMQWLKDYLEENGTVPSNDIFEAAEAAGFREKMVYTAKKRANIKARRGGFGGTGGWVWYV